jgi:hypothetical protein
MADPIRVYLDSLKAYDVERLKARKLIALISQVANVVQFNLPDFLASVYGLPLPTLARNRFRASDPSPQVDMGEWPDAAAIRQAFGDWHAAFLKLREAWDEVPEDDRRGLKEPPATLVTT